MTKDRPIIFSASMVRALLDDRKTQTRRLATSPLVRCNIGDRLWVREAAAIRGVYSDVVEVGYLAHERASHTEFVEQIPVELAPGAEVTWPRYRPSIHMPRWASRLTLTVTDVRTQRVQEISEEDAKAEGLYFRSWEVESGDDMEYCEGWSSDRFHAFKHSVGETAREGFEDLWNSLHTKDGERWDDNPAIVALTFSVRRENIDRLDREVAR